MKFSLIFVAFLISFFSYGQFVAIDENYSTQELVENFFISNSSVGASNFSQSTGIDFGNVNGIAAFTANGSDFPFQSGIVLSSGSANSITGPNLIVNSFGDNNWPGDIELENALNEPNSINASYIQFEFIPLANEITFDFIFASEEYNQNFECSYSDGIAFILTNQFTNVSQNLAVLPGTNIPLKATNVHPEVTGSCSTINEEYFEKYNFLPFNNENNSAIDFNGQTVDLIAQGNVVIGDQYSIKIVIADYLDTSYDSAIFLKAESFNFGVVLGNNDEYLSNFSTYPNPTTGIINIQSSNLNETVELAIYNLQGQVLVSDQRSPVNGAISVDLSTMNTGVYFIKIASEEGTVVKKVAKL